MCGIFATLNYHVEDLESILLVQGHRGPDGSGYWHNDKVQLIHNRLSIIDLSENAAQPMRDESGRYHIVYNGEIYNYRELRKELESEYTFRTESDTEVILAAFDKWGVDCLHHFIGMWAFVIWDDVNQSLFAARDRFGVKPLYYHFSENWIILASEIKAIHAAGIERKADTTAWASYLANGLTDYSNRTFWKGVCNLQPGNYLIHAGDYPIIRRWYNLSAAIREEDSRPENQVIEEYLALMRESVNYRFIADVPIGVNLSGGLDSSALLALTPNTADIQTFTFTCGNPLYDELPWVEKMLAGRDNFSHAVVLSPWEVPDLACEVMEYQDEPYSGIPTLAYSKCFEAARGHGVKVLLDGNGMDEQWAGYSYYSNDANALVQGAKSKATRPDCLSPEFAFSADQMLFWNPPENPVTKMQFRDITFTKIPRALRYNDRISMMNGVELREPFLDNRLVELALRQPLRRKIFGGVHKYLLRKVVKRLIPESVADAPKRPVQTPQREWLRGELSGWATGYIETAISNCPGWLEGYKVRQAWRDFLDGEGDNSYFVWQWICLGMMGVEA